MPMRSANSACVIITSHFPDAETYTYPYGRLGDETTRVRPDLWVPGFLIQCVSSPSATNPQTCQIPG